MHHQHHTKLTCRRTCGWSSGAGQRATLVSGPLVPDPPTPVTPGSPSTGEHPSDGHVPIHMFGPSLAFPTFGAANTPKARCKQQPKYLVNMGPPTFFREIRQIRAGYDNGNRGLGAVKKLSRKVWSTGSMVPVMWAQGGEGKGEGSEGLGEPLPIRTLNWIMEESEYGCFRGKHLGLFQLSPAYLIWRI